MNEKTYTPFDYGFYGAIGAISAMLGAGVIGVILGFSYHFINEVIKLF